LAVPIHETIPVVVCSEYKEPQMFLGVFTLQRYGVGTIAGFTLTRKVAETHQYHHGPMPGKGGKVENKLAKADRRLLAWLPSIERCFRIENILPRHLRKAISSIKGSDSHALCYNFHSTFYIYLEWEV
jgi:hypothetical protein